MSEAIIVVDTSQVREGRLDDLKAAVHELSDFVDANETRPILYSVYFDEDGALMTVVQVHPDSASMEYHMQVAAPIFAKFGELLTLQTMDLYGKPSEELLTLMRRKAQMLGNVELRVHERQAGLLRS